MDQTASDKDFRLVRYFMPSSLVAFILVALLLGYSFQRLAIKGMLENYESEHSNLAQVIANEMWEQGLAQYLDAVKNKPGSEIAAFDRLEILRGEVGFLLQKTRVFNIKVYDLKGRIVYSNDLQQLGQDKADNPGVISAINGKAKSELTHRNKFNTFEGTVENRDIVESYVPLRNLNDAAISGAFEIYGDATLALQAINQRVWWINASVLVLLAALYLALFVIVRRAQQIIFLRNQQREQAQQALTESEARWKFALEGADEGVWDRNLETGQVIFSKRYKQIYGFTENELENHQESWDARVHPDDLADAQSAREDYFSGKSARYSSERRMQCKDGNWKWILSRGEVVARDANGKALRMIGTHSDISARKVTENRLKLAANVFTCASEGIMITDAQGSIVEVNESFTRVTGYSRAEVLGRNPRFLKSGHQADEIYQNMWQQLLGSGHWNGEIWNRRKNGEVYAEMLTISAVRDESGKTQHFVALFADITPMKQYQQQLEHIAHFDALTDLPNRLLLADRLHQAIRQTQRRKNNLAVVYIDLDGFKTVNDTHGHDAGDALLVALSQRMKEALRDSDTLARIGGDEFVALLVDLNQRQDCEPLLERLLQAAGSVVEFAGANTHAVLQVSASLGVALYPADLSDAELLLQHADQAMYLAKQSGKNCCQFFAASVAESAAK